MAFDLTVTQAKLEDGWLKFKPTREDLGTAMAIVRNPEQKIYDLSLKQHRKKRSLDANAYAWVLIGKLADVMRLPPTIIYKNAIQNIGGNYEVIPVRDAAVAKFCEVWQKQGIGWPCVDMGPSKIPGYRNLRAYYGSSTYDTRQMSQLIDSLIQDCKAVGIETLSEQKLSAMMGGWNA